MATIRTSIQIQDRLSQPMRAMHNAVTLMVNQMEALHHASNGVIDTSTIELARRELGRVAEEFNRIDREIHEADNSQQRFTNHIRDGTHAASGLLDKILGIVAAYLTLRSIGDIVKLSDEMTNIDARLNLVVEGMPKLDPLSTKLNIDTSGLTEVQQLQQQIFDAAQRSFAPYTQTADLVGKLGMNAKDAFSNTNELVLFAELLNKQFGIAGTNAEGVTAATLQLTQALGSGVLRGEELNSVFESAPNIIHTIADYLDQPIGKIREMAKDGVLTADVVKNAMFAAANDINNKFNSMPLTFEQIWTEFQNKALWAFRGVLKQINEIFNSDRFAAFRESAGQSMQAIADMASKALGVIVAVGAFVYDNWSLIAPVIGTATAALGLYATALIAVKVAKIATTFWTGLQILAMGLLTATTWANVTATTAATAAAWGLNAALAANPVFIIIMAIVILIGVLYLAVAAVNHFAGTSISATGIVAGAFMVLVAFIYNRIAFMWNIFASIAEFFVNVWQHPMYSVKKLFYNLASNVLDQALAMSSGWDSFATGFVNAMISAVNGAIKAWNWFVGLLPDAIASEIGLSKGTEFSYRTSITSDLNNIKGSLKEWVGEAPADYWEAPKMQMKSLGEAWDTGYNWGNNLFSGDKEKEKGTSADELQRLIDEAMKNAMGTEGLGDKLDKTNRNGGSTAGNTAKMAKSLEGADEELKYLRELAEREAINRYTTAEIKVDMKNENHINSDMDIDGVIDRFGEKMEETAEAIAEGGDMDV